MYTGEISCKDEDGLKQFVNDHEGFIFVEEDSQEMVMLCFRHSDMRISPEEWEKMNCPVSVREIYGQMQKVKIVKDHKTHLTTFYYKHSIATLKITLLPATCGRKETRVYHRWLETVL